MVKNVFKKLGKKQKNNKGFSLVELIVVIAIMAVLVGILAPQLIKYVEKSREATDIQNCDSIASTLKSYYSDKEETAQINVTLSGTGVAGDTAALSDAGITNNNTKLKGKNWTSIAMAFDPTTGTVTYTITPNGSKHPYYTTSGDSTQLISTSASANNNGNNGNNGNNDGENGADGNTDGQ